jgi:hypothetical protein
VLAGPSVGRVVSIAFGEEVKCAVYCLGFDDSVNNKFAWVSGVLENDYVAVWVVGVEGFWVNTLDKDEVSNVQGSVKRVTVAITWSIVGYAHASADNCECWRNFRVQSEL